MPLPLGEVAERSEGGEGILPLPLGEVAERSEAGEGILPLPLGDVAERSEDGEGEAGASIPQAECFLFYIPLYRINVKKCFLFIEHPEPLW